MVSMATTLDTLEENLSFMAKNQLRHLAWSLAERIRASQEEPKMSDAARAAIRVIDNTSSYLLPLLLESIGQREKPLTKYETRIRRTTRRALSPGIQQYYLELCFWMTKEIWWNIEHPPSVVR